MIKPGLLDLDTLTTRLAELKERKGPPPWVERVVVTDQFTVTAICQPPGHPNDHHYHIYDEAWIIAEGELSWQYEHSPEPHVVRAGDVVFAPKNLWHHIEVLGDKPAIRVAVSVTGEFHRYDKPGCKPVAK
jgi:quercetin dioxygenase-like cupin family protein